MPGPGSPFEERFTPDQVIAALEAAGGVLLGAAIKLSCDRHTVERYRDVYPEVRAALVAIKEMRKDLAELKLLEAVDKGERWAIQHYLYWQATERGWGPKDRGAGDAPPGPPSAVPDIDLTGVSEALLRELQLRLRERRLASHQPERPDA